VNRVIAAATWTAGEIGESARHPHMPRTRRGRVAAIATVVVLAAAVAGGVWWQSARLPSDAALAVGDQVVTVAQLDDRMETLHAMYGVQPPIDPAKLDTFRRDAAKAVAVGLVLDDRSKQLDVGVADTKVRDELTAYVTQQFGPGPDGHAAFVRALGNVGTSEDRVLDEIRQQMNVTQLFDKVTHDVTATDADAQAAFGRYAARLGTPEKRTLRNIVVKDQAQAQKLADQIKGGADFAGVAKGASLDLATRDKGGDLGQLAASQLEPTYAAAVFTASAGSVYGPLQNRFGWNVGQVVAVTPGVPAQYDQVKDKARALLEFDRRLAAWTAWLQGAIKGGDVRYADAYRPADPDSVPAGASPAGSGAAPPGVPPAGPGSVPADSGAAPAGGAPAGSAVPPGGVPAGPVGPAVPAVPAAN
jgi:peptidyl-prolyl cis-trans isomerase C